MKSVAILLSHQPTTEQLAQLENEWGVGRIVPLPDEFRTLWTSVPPDGPFPKEAFAPLLAWLEQSTAEGDLVWVQGEFGATFLVSSWCFAHRRIPVYATTRRESEDHAQPDGSVVRRQVFRHVRFREYPIFP
ncbi:MAG: hypothetical protein BLM47_06675 [Candidatus Reconcilbacillus cellulovorans]|uniref:CRISPR-associated protein n=1 Tax=Candidatus Reconcilbacillus cellulovorans TaxID=1906605 RepID=A0A2A6E0U8_9BACL|nr:MAG: hypothetical protein BLM47_06675 [Candidatus Reconcilbacillus cellulovorans]